VDGLPEMQGEGATQHTTPFVDTVTPEVDWIFLPTKALCCIVFPYFVYYLSHKTNVDIPPNGNSTNKSRKLEARPDRLKVC
jgi:hypothetical protein